MTTQLDARSRLADKAKRSPHTTAHSTSRCRARAKTVAALIALSLGTQAKTALAQQATTPNITPTTTPNTAPIVAPNVPAPSQMVTPTPEPIRYRLGNGLTVILEERHGVPQIAARMIVHAGRRDQPQGHTGLAHMLEHLMFERSTQASAEFSTLFESLGAIHVNGETSDEQTVYHAVMPAHRLAEVLWLESGRLGFLLQRMDQATLDAQRRVVQSEHRERVDDVGGGFFLRFVNEAWYPVGHPQRDVFEHPEDVTAIRLSDLRWFFQRWYVPANVTLVLVGDFATVQARQWIEQYFGSLANTPVPLRSAVAPVTISAERRIVVEAPAGNRVLLRWPTPAWLAPGDADATLAAFVLSGTTHSRLDRRLVDELDIASSVNANQISDSESGMFTIAASGAEEHTNDELMIQIDAALDVLRTQLIAQAEFDRAKRRVVERVRREGLTLESRCEQLASYGEFDRQALDLTAVQLEQLQQSTPQSVMAFARRWLAPEHRLVAFLRQTYREERRGVLAQGPVSLQPRNALRATTPTVTPTAFTLRGAQ